MAFSDPGPRETTDVGSTVSMDVGSLFRTGSVGDFFDDSCGCDLVWVVSRSSGIVLAKD